MTREKPIVFSTEMVKVILSSTKTKTRQAIKPQPTRVQNSIQALKDHSHIKIISGMGISAIVAWGTNNLTHGRTSIAAMNQHVTVSPVYGNCTTPKNQVAHGQIILGLR